MIGPIEYHNLNVQIMRYDQAKTDEQKCKIARSFFDAYMGKSDARLTLEAVHALLKRIAELEKQTKENDHEKVCFD